MQKKAQTFNDGIVSIYRIDNIAAEGDMPENKLTKVVDLRYEERTVGMNRYWIASQYDVKIDLLIRCARIGSVISKFVAVPKDGKQYRIEQIQYSKDADIPCMDLSLERIGAEYDIV